MRSPRPGSVSRPVGAGAAARAGLVVVLVAVVAAVVATFLRSTDLVPAGTPGGGAGGYPARLETPWWTTDLPDRPGALAGVVERVAHGDGHDEPLGWYAVSPAGRLWRIPGAVNGYPPALSPDGTRLAYLDARPGQGFRVVNVVTGESISGDIGVLENRARYPWELAPQLPSFWSPDSSRLLVQGYAAHGTRETVVDLVVDEAGTTEVRAPRTGGPRMPVGWVSDGSLAWLAWRTGNGVAVGAARVLVTDQRGHPLRAVRLGLGAGVAGFSQWASLVSPGGLTLALGARSPGRGAGIGFYDLATGRLRAVVPDVRDAAYACLPTWGHRTLQVPTSENPQDAALVSVDGSVTIQADPRLGITCSHWATDALDGRAHHGFGGRVFGQSSSWLSWHWREAAGALAGGLLLVGGIGLALVVRRRRA